MALNIKNFEVEKLACEVAELSGETKTEAIRKALAERKERLTRGNILTKGQRARRYLQEEIWPKLDGSPSPTKQDIESMLGYGEQGF